MLNYLLEESKTLPNPIKAHLNIITIKQKISNILDKHCLGGSCYDCKNLNCKRLHDAESWHMNKLLKMYKETI